MKKHRDERIFFFSFVILLIAFSSYVFYLDSRDIALAPVKSAKPPINQPISAPPVAVVPPYCDVPVALPNINMSTFYRLPNIDRGNIVFANSAGGISFYNLGPDHKLSNDDLGLIMPINLQTNNPNVNYPYLKIYENNVLFVKEYSTGINWVSELWFYSIGNDSIPGTADDSGQQIMSTPNLGPYSLMANLGKDFVSFTVRLGSSYYCTLDDSGCLNSQINPILRREIGFGNSSGWVDYWTQYNMTNNRQDIYFQSNNQQSSLFISGNPSLSLLDYSPPFILIQDNINSTLSFGIEGNPQMLVPIMYNSNLSSLDLSNHYSASTNSFYLALSKMIYGGYTYSVISIPSLVEVEIPNTSGIMNGKVSMDDTTLIISDGYGIYVSECYFQ